jgi:hypothetical protein
MQAAKNELGAKSKKLAGINLSAIHGESGTGFEKAGERGEFECGNCEYFNAEDGACSQKDMMKRSKQPRLKDGRISVAAEDCCSFIERIGKDKDED